jgi:hypothetical protein
MEGGCKVSGMDRLMLYLAPPLFSNSSPPLSPPLSTQVCIDGLQPRSKNKRNNVSILIRFTSPHDGKTRAVQIDCGKTFRDSVLSHYPEMGVQVMNFFFQSSLWCENLDSLFLPSCLFTVPRCSTHHPRSRRCYEWL